MAKLIEDIYSGSAAIGNLRASITLIIGVIIAFCLSILGTSVMTSTSNRSSTTKAVVEDSTCIQNNQTQICTTNVKYNVDNKEYKQQVNTHDTKLNNNDTIDIQYDPTNPNDISYKESNMFMGSMFSFIGLIILCIVVLYYYVIRTYKPLAAIEGARTTVDIAKNIFD